jgi:periplasmic divalent cation tolerance protein
MDSRPLTLVLTTEADRGRAERLAVALLERRLAVCVSLLPVRSHYRWQGRLEADEEVQLLIKTDPDRLESLHAAVLELHSYDTPEWIHWQAATAGGYAEWCAEQVGSGAG